MKRINQHKTPIFSVHETLKDEWSIAHGIEARRHTDGSVEVKITRETERDDMTYLQKNLSASEAEALGRALLCIPADKDFGAIMSRTTAWSE